MTRTDKINLAATILGPVLVSGMIYWAKWSFEAKLTIAFDAQDRRNAEMFQTRAEADKIHAAISGNVDKLSTRVGNVEQDVATIRGEMKHERKQ